MALFISSISSYTLSGYWDETTGDWIYQDRSSSTHNAVAAMQDISYDEDYWNEDAYASDYDYADGIWFTVYIMSFIMTNIKRLVFVFW